MILNGKHYELMVDRPIFGEIFIGFDNKWQCYYIKDGTVLSDMDFSIPAMINLVCICLKYEFKLEEFNDQNIIKFKKRFTHLIQYNNKMELETLINLTLMKLDNVIETMENLKVRE